MQKKSRERVIRVEYDDAIRKYYFSAKRNSLRTTYELMILERYTNVNGKLQEDIPTWDSFRHYYDRYWSKTAQKKIARDGLSNYQRNERMLYGSAMAYRDCVGSYQIDETMGDVFLVSKFDRSKVIGRPYIYLAVDTCTQLITGVHVGLEAGEDAMLACIANAVSDKVGYCASLDIEIAQEDWPCSGMPTELITDKGGEFTGQRLSELCIRYGVEINTLPPFRAEEKPLVERIIGLVQDSYKSMLQGKGGIGADANERWAIDYRQQAVLTLEEYTQIVIHCIINLNKGRVLKGLGHLPVGVPQTPAELWSWFCEQGKTALLDVDEREVYLRSLPRTTAKVSRRGICFNKMRYLPPKGIELRIGARVELAYDVQHTDFICEGCFSSTGGVLGLNIKRKFSQQIQLCSFFLFFTQFIFKRSILFMQSCNLFMAWCFRCLVFFPQRCFKEFILSLKRKYILIYVVWTRKTMGAKKEGGCSTTQK